MGRKKNGTPARDHLQRHRTHVIDEKARRHFTNSIPPEWVANRFDEGDYGKDYHVEVTGGNGQVTRAFYVQLKGTARCKYIDGGSAVSFSLDKRYLAHYLGEVKLPVFLVVVDVEAGRGYWVFVQQYLARHPGWEKAASYSLRIPTANRLEDTARVVEAVAAALDWMTLFQQKPLQDRMKDYLRELGAKDPRFRIEATFGEDEERLRLIPREPVKLEFRFRPKRKKLVAKMRADFLDKGLPVKFGAGELAVEGSALFNEVVAGGGTFQLSARSDCLLTLTLDDEHGRPVEVWPGIPGEVAGGRKEYRFVSRLGRSPLEVTAGPIGADAGGSINLSVDPISWEGQPLLSASYFDRINSFFSKLLTYPDLGATGEVEGNTIFAVKVRMDEVTRFGPVVEFLKLVGKAREVAKHFGINPTCTRTNLSGAALDNIEVAHALLTTGRYNVPSPDMRVDITFDKAVASRFGAEERTINDVVLCADEGYRYPFMDHELDLGRLAWELSEAALYTPDGELRRLLAGPGESVRVSFRTTHNTRRVLRVLSDGEWDEYKANPATGIK